MSMKGKGVKERKGGGESEQKRKKKEKVVKKRKANEIKKVAYKREIEREREEEEGEYIYIFSPRKVHLFFFPSIFLFYRKDSSILKVKERN